MAANTHTTTGRYLTRFAIWLLQQPELDSNLGFRATDLDLVWENEQQNLWMILEVKCLGRPLPRFQAKIIKRIHDLASADPTYLGAHTIIFQRTNPEDGKIQLDGKEVNPDELRRFLEFRCEAELYQRGPFPRKPPALDRRAERAALGEDAGPGEAGPTDFPSSRDDVLHRPPWFGRG